MVEAVKLIGESMLCEVLVSVSRSTANCLNVVRCIIPCNCDILLLSKDTFHI